jgi:hypothetical protein
MPVLGNAVVRSVNYAAGDVCGAFCVGGVPHSLDPLQESEQVVEADATRHAHYVLEHESPRSYFVDPLQEGPYEVVAVVNPVWVSGPAEAAESLAGRAPHDEVYVVALKPEVVQQVATVYDPKVAPNWFETQVAPVCRAGEGIDVGCGDYFVPSALYTDGGTTHAAE